MEFEKVVITKDSKPKRVPMRESRMWQEMEELKKPYEQRKAEMMAKQAAYGKDKPT